MIRRYRDRFFALCLPLAVVPFLTSMAVLIYIGATDDSPVVSLEPASVVILLLSLISEFFRLFFNYIFLNNFSCCCCATVPTVLTCVELVSEQHIANRRIFSEATCALLGGVAFGAW